VSGAAESVALSSPGWESDGSYMGFVGVSTGSSSIMRVFPRWAEVLGLPTRTLKGYDIAVDSSPATYRDVITAIRDDPRHRGALVTTHKMAVFDAAAELFDEVDELARTFGEISSVAKRDGRLTGSAKDPLTARLALEELLAPDHFATSGGAALVLGSGGAGCALTHQLGLRSDPPSAIVCTALSQGPLDHQRRLHERAGIDPARVRYVLTAGAVDVDRLLAELPPASLVVNATGMGKDRPGSPVGHGRFPERAVVWEFNYRGPLDFLHQAQEQQAARELVVEDGWRYFIHGWTQVIAEVFDTDMPAATVTQLSDVAAGVR